MERRIGGNGIKMETARAMVQAVGCGRRYDGTEIQQSGLHRE
ncbi:MAG: hypothetical protein WC588_00275 [Candidatus Micrarchaeia archaeon]